MRHRCQRDAGPVVDLLLAVITPEYDAIGETISEMHSVDMAYSTIARLSLLAYCALIVPFTIRASHMPELSGPWVRVMVFGLWLHIHHGRDCRRFPGRLPR